MSTFKVLKIHLHSAEQIELIDEDHFSTSSAEQELFSFSMVLPESDLKNFKEGDVIKVHLNPAS